MERELGIKRFRKKVEEMGIGFINTLNMTGKGIVTRADEAHVKKHLIMADFFSDIIIKELNVGK